MAGWGPWLVMLGSGLVAALLGVLAVLGWALRELRWQDEGAGWDRTRERGSSSASASHS